MNKIFNHISTQRIVLFLLVAFAVQSCDLFRPKQEKEAVARVGESFLYKEDIERLLSGNVSKQDSAVLVSNYINNWATQQLLYNNALINISEERQQDLNALVNEYKNDLFAKVYKEAVVKTNIDTVVLSVDLLKYYEANKENFKLNEELLKLRYIHLGVDNSDVDEVKDYLKNFELEDRQKLDSLSLQFNAFSLNDSIWVKAAQVYNKLPKLTDRQRDKYLKKSQFFELKDSLGVYLIYLKDMLQRNETAPLEYVKPTIKQIILNKRKLEYIRNFEKEILTDATKNNKFETY
ncbi:peptidyl-prolyl cis-trans isomerase [Spongiivirga citrea]|uniref:peptidyl-prolyl cis-trans isomerase n=1 Tax=Spongiivirga citrea TaxID=1481457 RepID=UPI001EF854A0|nr:peptidyl-prolyl cis-trans isomerase [Spongiivirga citrea]